MYWLHCRHDNAVFDENNSATTVVISGKITVTFYVKYFPNDFWKNLHSSNWRFVELTVKKSLNNIYRKQFIYVSKPLN